MVMEVDTDMKVLSREHLATPLAIGSLLLVLISALSCSCKPDPPELDISLLTDVPCRAPCWHNIVPGVSDEDQVRVQLQGNPVVKKGTLMHEPTEWGGVQLDMFAWQARSEHYNRVHLRDGKVLRIQIRVDHDWTLGEAVDKFGPPEGVYAKIYGHEYTGYVVVFHYPAQGLIFDSNTLPIDRRVYLGDGKGVLQEDLKVTETTYFAPTSLEGMMSEVYFYSPEDMEDWLADIHEWEGFGEVELAR